jgi:predicted nucleotidyltransferase
MLPNPEALRAVVGFLAQYDIPYMVIGGLANAVWGEVRATRDADFKISIGNRSLNEFRELVLQRFSERETSVPPHLRSGHVIHIWAMPGVAVDLLVSIFDYERQAIERAIPMTMEGVPVRVCTAEDLVIHKVVANREQDWIDVERVLIRQKSKLDQGAIVNWIKHFAEALDTPEMLARYQQLRASYDPQGKGE